MGQTQNGQNVLCQGVIWQANKEIPKACGYQFQGGKPDFYQQVYRQSSQRLNPELYKIREYSTRRKAQYVERQLPNPKNDAEQASQILSKSSRQKTKQNAIEFKGPKHSDKSGNYQDSYNLHDLEVTKKKSAYESLHDLGDDQSIKVSASPEEATLANLHKHLENTNNTANTSIPSYQTAASNSILEANVPTGRGQPQHGLRNATQQDLPHFHQNQLKTSNGNHPYSSSQKLSHPQLPSNSSLHSASKKQYYQQPNQQRQMHQVYQPQQPRPQVLQSEYYQNAPQSNQYQLEMQRGQHQVIRKSRQVQPPPKQMHPQIQGPQPYFQVNPAQNRPHAPPPPDHHFQNQQNPVYGTQNLELRHTQSQIFAQQQKPQVNYQQLLHRQRQHQLEKHTSHRQQHQQPHDQMLGAPMLPPFQRYSIQDTPEEAAAKRNHAMEERFREVAYHYSQHNVDFAFHRSQQMLKQYEPEFKSHPAYAERMRFLELIASEYKDIIAYWSEFSKPTWSLKSNQHGIKISTCYEEGNVAVLVESELRVPIEVLIAVITQINMYPKFTPFMTYSKQEKRISRNSRIGHSINEFPILSTRQAFFQGIGYNRLDTNNTLFLYTRSIHNRPDLLQLYDYKPNPKKDSVMLQYKYLCLEYTPISRAVGYLRMCINVNMKVKLLPRFILQAASKKFGQEFFQNIYKISRNFKGSEWETEVKKDPELYNYFQRVMSEFYTKHGMN